MNLMTRFWNDEAGFVVSSELVLLATIVVLGLVTGMSSIRNGVVQELGDLSDAFGVISQDYTFSGVSGHASSTAGSFYTDNDDFCDDDDSVDADDAEPACMGIDDAAATIE